MFDVLVVGSSNLDTFLHVSKIPLPGETVLGTSTSRAGGGKGANQAVASARAGVNTGFLSAVGQDEGGTFLKEALAKDGIDLTHLVTSEVETGSAFITLSEDAENSIVVIPGANRSPELREYASRNNVDAKVKLFSLEIDMDTIESVVSQSKDSTLVVNAAPVADIPASIEEKIDVLIVNEHEGASLSGKSNVDEIISELLNRVPAVIMTLGGQGSIVAERDKEPVRIQPHKVTPVDTTGAGDTFCGYFCAGLATGADIVAAAQTASIAGALATTVHGAQPSVPTIDQVRSA